MNIAVGARARGLIVVAMLPVSLLGQERVKPVTVCEVLANAKRLSTSSPVGVLGRLYCPPSLENACWLTEDHCDQPVVYAGRAWPSKIWIEFIQPETVLLKVEVDRAVLREKLSVIRKTTKLGMHQTMLFKSKDGVIVPNGWGDEPDKWAVVYGRISITKALQHYSGAAVAISRNDLQVIKDEDYEEPK
jgi:hypothetical protein